MFLWLKKGVIQHGTCTTLNSVLKEIIMVPLLEWFFFFLKLYIIQSAEL